MAVTSHDHVSCISSRTQTYHVRLPQWPRGVLSEQSSCGPSQGGLRWRERCCAPPGANLGQLMVAELWMEFLRLGGGCPAHHMHSASHAPSSVSLYWLFPYTHQDGGTGLGYPGSRMKLTCESGQVSSLESSVLMCHLYYKAEHSVGTHCRMEACHFSPLLAKLGATC